MNYFEWSQEYSAEADKINKVITTLTVKCKKASRSEKKLLEARIRDYRQCYRECVEISDLLLQRHRGVA
ncbi:MAG TPA: hypothetical protein DEO32_00250 [Ruminococcaceae bacterium]|nr:hypothetical protein [Oscillospiraceae bacterium]